MTDRAKIVCTDPECRFTPADLDRLASAGDVRFAPDYEIATLSTEARDADVLVTSCFASVPAAVINAGERLKGVVKYGVGVDNIDIPAADARGVVVANCPDYGSDSIADLAFAMLLAHARKLPRIERTMREEGWFWPDDAYLGTALEGQTIGIVGLGRIGRRMARRAAGFDMRILTIDPAVGPDDLADEPFEAEFVPFDRLLAESDFVSIHCVLTPDTRGLFGAAELRQMKRTAYLLNVSRGAIIDQPALVDSIRSGEIAGAGLDVFAEEPLTKDNPLFELGDRVIIVPHLAWYTQQAAEEQSQQAADAVLAVLAGQRPRSVVSR